MSNTDEKIPELIHGDFRVDFFNQAASGLVYGDVYDRNTGRHLYTSPPVRNVVIARAVTMNWIREQQEQIRNTQITGDNYITA